MPFSVISRAWKPVPQNNPTPTHTTVVAISDAYGVLPRQSSQSHIASVADKNVTCKEYTSAVSATNTVQMVCICHCKCPYRQLSVWAFAVADANQ